MTQRFYGSGLAPGSSWARWGLVPTPSLFETGGELGEAAADSRHPTAQFHDVQTANASLALADESLMLVEPCGKLLLGQAGALARLPKFREEVLVVG